MVSSEMNKSFCTNVVAVFVTVCGVVLDNNTLYMIGIFALSGALTNWLAIHMLFEKVPGLYGSGVIPSRFEEFKTAIKQMIMEQFFSSTNLASFMDDEQISNDLNLKSLISKVDFAPTFDGLIEVVQQSSFGAMLEMVGGTATLEPMREPFVKKIQQSIIDTTETTEFKVLLSQQLKTTIGIEGLVAKVEVILDQRLQELTPVIVKEIVQNMIKQHLGWLVVWGGVFGGIIGGVASIVS
jgi:uncharacterized membrane protein YheB (UPF0754 family)